MTTLEKAVKKSKESIELAEFISNLYRAATCPIEKARHRAAASKAISLAEKAIEEEGKATAAAAAVEASSLKAND